jgi:cell division protein FtsA
MAEDGFKMPDFVFGLDIGTRNVVGTVGYKDGKTFHVVAQYAKQHQTRAMIDGQIHDIVKTGKVISAVKKQLEVQMEQPLTDVCIAAAGRVLRTVTTSVSMEFDADTVIEEEQIHTLELMGVEQAQHILNEENDTHFRFYSVGYSVIRYFLNGDPMINLQGHKAYKISVELIVTFLPEEVVDGLYAAVAQAGLNVANLTLEPIAAINVAIPEKFRSLNIALIDVGAGTSDISITDAGSVIAYGMIPHAGDEMTEAIAKQYLVDFNTAERMKLAAGGKNKKTVSYTDIMSLKQQVPATEVLDVIRPVMEQTVKEIADKIKELNGGKTVAAAFVVGGGGKVRGFTEKLAEELGLIKQRVALRGEEVLGDVHFEQTGIRKDPLLVTPIGICLSSYDRKNNFIFVRFNGERIKLYDNDKLTVVDAAVAAGFPNADLFPKSGAALNYTINGRQRLLRGGPGEAAVITLNGKEASLGESLSPNCEIEIVPSSSGEAAQLTLAQIEELQDVSIEFFVNGKIVSCPKFAAVNGEISSPFYSIQDGDEIELRPYYTVKQLIDFMDVEVDFDQEILVNGKDADFETPVYENFNVDWTIVSYRTTAEDAKDAKLSIEEDKMPEEEMPEEQAQEAEEPVVKDEKEAMDEYIRELNMDESELKKSEIGRRAREAAEKKKEQEKREAEAANVQNIDVMVNGSPVVLSGKNEYVFVDIFDHIPFDLSKAEGNFVVTKVNGEKATYTQAISAGDKIEVYWEK